MRHPSILAFFFCIVFITQGFSQVKSNGVPYINNYSIDDYSPSGFRASPQNWEVFQDSTGLMFFGNTDGLLIYDGDAWRFRFLPNNSILRSIGSDTKNNIYLGGENEFGMLHADSAGRFHYRSFMPLVPDSVNIIRNVWEITNLNDTVVFMSHNKLFFYYKDSIVDIIATQDQFFHQYIYNDDLFVFEADVGLSRLEDGKLRTVPDGEYFRNHTAWVILPFGKDSLLFASPVDGLTIYHGGKFESWDIPASDFLQQKRVYCGVRLRDGNFAFGTRGSGVVIMNEEGRIIQLINKDNGLQNDVVLDISVDQRGDIWVALTNGISFIKVNSPFSYYTSDYGIPRQNYYVEDYKNHLFFSNDEGVYVKPLNDISKELQVEKVQLISGTEGQSWLFQKAGEFLLCGHNTGVLVFKDSLLHKILPVPVNVWQILPDPEDNSKFYALSLEGIYILRLHSNDISVEKKLKGYSENVIYAEFDTTGYLWISDEMSGVKRLKLNGTRDSVLEVTTYTRENGLPSTEGNWILRVEDEVVLTNPSVNGFYHYNPLNDNFKSYESLNERFGVNGEITLYTKGPKGNYWLRDNGLVRIFGKNEGHFYELDTPFLKFKGRNLERLSFLDSTIAFFGTDEYVLNYYLSAKADFQQFYNSHIRKVISMKNDSILFNGNMPHSKDRNLFAHSGEALSLSYSLNALRFEFSAAYFEEPGNTKYKVWLEGLESEPDVWILETNKEYTNLQEGEYIFHVKAKNIHGIESNESSFYFSVEPPWYRTVYAYFGYIIIFIVLLYLGIWLYVRKLKADRDRLERIVKERTSEIQQQKEEISVQAEELERINQELQKLSLVASKTDNAVIIANAEGNIEWINDGFIRLFGYSLNELKNTGKDKIENLGDEKEWKEMLLEVNRIKKFVIKESEITTRDGQKRNIQTTLTPILNYENSILKYIAISTDISRLKEVQEELQKLIATKDKFFSIIAHDLKNPFHSLMGISELLTKYHDSYEHDKLKELYAQLYNVTHKGYQLLTNLLEWSRSQTGNLKFKPETTDIAQLVNNSLDILISTAESKNIKVKNNIKPGLNVIADKNTITTVVRNLVSNAVKYSREGGTVIISAEERENDVKVNVEDNGVGISPENIEKLFRIDINFSTKGTYDESGTGLGLLLCKEFVEKNGGKIFVESILGEGSTFSFTLDKP